MYNQIEALTLEEYNNIREALLAVKKSDFLSAHQSKIFFTDVENFDLVMDKLEFLMLYGSRNKFSSDEED